MIQRLLRRPAGPLSRRICSCALLALAVLAPVSLTAQRADATDSTALVPPSVSSADAGAALGLIPRLTPLNPIASARTGLYVQPYTFAGEGWRSAVDLSYASAVEYQDVGTARYLFDAELLHLELTAARDIGERGWVSGSVGAAAAFNGALDRLFDWYHARIGFVMEERDVRPADVFADSLDIPALGIARNRQRPGVALADVRLTTGIRWSAATQTALSMTLPTAPVQNLYGRGVPTVNVLQTVRGHVRDRAVIEASAGIGYAPRRGPLSAIQREVFWLGSASTRLRLWGGHAAYATLVSHSPTYRRTGLRILDAGELTADFGYAYRWASGRELRIGLAEDIFRQDQGLDLALRVSVVR